MLRLRWSIMLTVAIVFLSHSREIVHAADLTRPNIVLILADDLGFSDLGCYGSEIATPNLDRLAANGLKFTQFYNCARCCPTRASLMTGHYPHQVGVGHMEGDEGYPGYRGVLPDGCQTIANSLRERGYRTMLSGKWNLGFARPHYPADHGFDRFFGLLRGAADYFDPRVGPRNSLPRFAFNDQPFTEFDDDFYATDAFTDYAERWIRECAGQAPFFLYLSYTAPHSPLQARPEDIAKYRGKYRTGWDQLRKRRHARIGALSLIDSTMSLSARDDRVPSWMDVADQDFEDLKMSVYAAQVECMDRGVGRIVAALQQVKVIENTLILFLSDNGGDGEPEAATKLPPGPKGSSHIYGRPWAQLSNTPFRGYKHEAWEGGIATPLIAHWPAKIRRAGISRDVGHVIDLLPTCLEAAGGDQAAPGDQARFRIEGKSLVPIFETGHRPPHESLCWEHEGHRAIRQGDWKLVGPHKGRWQLFDLSMDRTEARDLASSNPDRVQEMSKHYETWAERCGVVSWDEILAKKRKP